MRRISNRECVRNLVCSMVDDSSELNMDSIINHTPFMHHAVAGTNDAIGLLHIDGDMLNNTNDNVVQFIPLDPFIDDSPRTPKRHRSTFTQRTSLHPNNVTGISGLSQSKDGSRFYVKVQSDQGEQRKSISVKGLKRSLALGNELTQLQLGAIEDERMKAFSEAAMLIAMTTSMPITT